MLVAPITINLANLTPDIPSKNDHTGLIGDEIPLVTHNSFMASPATYRESQLSVQESFDLESGDKSPLSIWCRH